MTIPVGNYGTCDGSRQDVHWHVVHGPCATDHKTPRRNSLASDKDAAGKPHTNAGTATKMSAGSAQTYYLVFATCDVSSTVFDLQFIHDPLFEARIATKMATQWSSRVHSSKISILIRPPMMRNVHLILNRLPMMRMRAMFCGRHPAACNLPHLFTLTFFSDCRSQRERRPPMKYSP